MFKFTNKYGEIITGEEGVRISGETGLLLSVIATEKKYGTLTLDRYESEEVLEGLLKLHCDTFRYSPYDELLCEVCEHIPEVATGDFYASNIRMKEDVKHEDLRKLAMLFLTMSIQKKRGAV